MSDEAAAPRRTIASTCWECSTTCGAILTVEGGRVVKVGPNRDHPGSRGAFCAKGIRALPRWTYRGGRLLHPMRRRGPRGAGEWEAIGWPEAIDEMARGIAGVIERHGPLAVAGAVSGGFFSRGAIVALMLRALGSPNWMINQDLCGGCRGVSDRVTGLGITGGEDIDDARAALVVGRNPYAANPVEWRALERLARRGGRIVVIDPLRTPAARLAALWLRPRPGTDGAIALAMIHTLIEEGRYDRDFVEHWCHGFDALAGRVREFTPARAEHLSGVPAADVVAAARLFADGPSVFVSGHGIDAVDGGFQTFRAFHCLVAVAGYVDVPGGNRRAKKPAGARTYLDLVHAPEHQLPPAVAGRAIGAERFPLWSGPQGWQTACHNPSVIDAVLTGSPYPVRAMYVSGVNIAVTYPDTRRTLEALRSLDFLAVAAHEMNPTAAWADIVLPKTTTLEEEEVQIQQSGPCVSYTAPAHAPLGEARCDLEIASDLLDRLAREVPVDRALLPWRSQRAFNRHLLGDSEIDWDTLVEKGFSTFEFTLGDFEAAPFPTATGKVELYSERLASIGQDPLPGFVPPRAEREPPGVRDAFPLVLITGVREKNYHHSRFRDQDWLRAQSPDPVVEVHPETVADAGLADGAWVEVEVAGGPGRFRARLSATERVPPGLAATGMGWWYPEASGPLYGAAEVNVNAALGYGAPFDPVSGSPDSGGIRCRLVPGVAPTRRDAR